ncbi:MAG: tRNA (cytidine(34)-2'-O)-methyltransferase [Candidatus Cloacimonetes bacterium]|nr:tRNA (cytidine(34)-2'-O)-methyltransferase [Candidatus Cloacimonadota bacterium]
MAKNNDSLANSDVNFHVVLFQPEIPSNTGNIGRLCVGTNSMLHIIKPMRFMLTDKLLKRAGLDYWDKLKIRLHSSLDELWDSYPHANAYYCTTKTDQVFTSRQYQHGDFFVFGAESRGIPVEILKKKQDRNITIPMSPEVRSLNLSNSVAIVIYEAWRQVGF